MCDNSFNASLAIDKIIADKINNILGNVAKDFDISEKDIAKYLVNENDKPNKKFNGKECEQCMGRKQDGKQCTRKRKPGKEFCGKHETNRRYGRIDDENTVEPIKKTDTIRFITKEIKGTKYLIDGKNNVIDFSDIECPEFIGNYDGQNIIKCF